MRARTIAIGDIHGCTEALAAVLAAIKPAEIENSRRFLSLDLNYGHRVDSEMYEYLMDNGMTKEEWQGPRYYRLKTIKGLQERGAIDGNLRRKSPSGSAA